MQKRLFATTAKNWIILGSACLLPTLAVAGLFGPSIDTATWTEEVQQSDGTVIHVNRESKRGSNGFPNAHRGGLVSFQLEYPALGIKWKSADASQDPLSFDIIDGTPYLVLQSRDFASCNKVADGSPAAYYLKWQSGKWVSLSKQEVPFDKMRVNLMDNPWGGTKAKDAKGLVNLREKGFRDSFNGGGLLSKWFSKGTRICSKDTLVWLR